MTRKLYRSRSNKVIAGVCGGLGDYFDVDPAFVRVAFVLLGLANGIGLIGYIVLAIILPREESVAQGPAEVVRENVREMGQAVSSVVSRGEPGESAPAAEEDMRRRRRYLAGLVLIVLGVIFLMGNFNLFSWLNWGKLWPLLLIGVGAAIIWARGRR